MDANGWRSRFTARADRSFDSAVCQLVFSTPKGEGEEHRLPRKEFAPAFRGRGRADAPPLDPASITSVGFLASDKQAGPSQLEVAWIKAAPAASP